LKVSANVKMRPNALPLVVRLSAKKQGVGTPFPCIPAPQYPCKSPWSSFWTCGIYFSRDEA